MFYVILSTAFIVYTDWKSFVRSGTLSYKIKFKCWYFLIHIFILTWNKQYTGIILLSTVVIILNLKLKQGQGGKFRFEETKI